MAGSAARARGAKAAAALAVLAAAAWAGPNVWIARSTRAYTYTSAEAVPARTFAIVPGSPVSRGRPSPVLRDRLGAALELYRGGRVKTILVSGQDTPASPEATVMRAWLEARGVPAVDIWSDGGGTRTRQTMNRAVATYGVGDAIVCTQTVNVARSIYLARRAGIDAIGLALPTPLERSTRYVAKESLKTTLAFAESQLRPRPTPAAPILAAR
jgi:vancomycin permeability regulator SanA